MKRSAFILGLLVLFLFLVLVLKSPDPNVPRFKKLSSPVVLQPSHVFSYDLFAPSPFGGGKMWITAWLSGTNGQAFLYDIDRREVLGELTNGWPVLPLGKESKVLCVQTVSGPRLWKEALLRLV